MATELTWLGHGAWSIRTGENTLLVDPFLDDSPTAPVRAEAVEADHILVTHGHFDHVADAVPVARRTGAMVVAIAEIVGWAEAKGVERTHGMNLGGGYGFPFGRGKMTPALHSSTLPDGTPGGDPAGFLLTLEGKNVYVAGDTALFSDMRLIGDVGLDLALLPIGDNFTMGPDDALAAVKLLRPRRVIPMHYSTWEVIEQDPHAWAARVRTGTEAEPVVLEPGGSVSI
jgi:L-ascorbate metabolism protein UlaG (beta-lactamase superfamily)